MPSFTGPGWYFPDRTDDEITVLMHAELIREATPEEIEQDARWRANDKSRIYVPITHVAADGVSGHDLSHALKVYANRKREERASRIEQAMLENSAGRYEIGWHASDANVCHVALVDDDGRDDLFDVQLYDPEVVEANGKTARDNSLAALERLVERANR